MNGRATTWGVFKAYAFFYKRDDKSACLRSFGKLLHYMHIVGILHMLLSDDKVHALYV